jgi:hypothetical protein
MTKRLSMLLAVVLTTGTSALGQSTDEKSPTPITSNVLTGTVRGSGTYVYSLKSKRGQTVRVRAELTLAGDGSQGFSLDFRGKAGGTGGQTTCCEGETYMSLSADPTLNTSFQVTTDEYFLLFLNFSAPGRALPYRITFDGLNLDAEPQSSALGARTASAQVLPDKARALLDEEYQGWELSPGDPPCPRETTLADDFDGDGKEDYAVMLKLKRTVSIVVLLADGEGFKSREVKRGLRGNEFVTVAPKGEVYSDYVRALGKMESVRERKLKLATLVVHPCGGGEKHYLIPEYGDLKDDN